MNGIYKTITIASIVISKKDDNEILRNLVLVDKEIDELHTVTIPAILQLHSLEINEITMNVSVRQFNIQYNISMEFVGQ